MEKNDLQIESDWIVNKICLDRIGLSQSYPRSFFYEPFRYNYAYHISTTIKSGCYKSKCDYVSFVSVSDIGDARELNWS